MKAFLFAAGFGTRLAPLTDSLPKPLIHVKGMPLVLYSLSLLKEAGVTEIVANLHYRGDMIEEYFALHENFGFTVTWSREAEILGTGGGVMQSRDLLESEPFLVINSDIITDVYLEKVIGQFIATQTTVLVISPAPPHNTTVSLVDDRVVDFRGVLGSGVAPTCDYTGIGLVHPEIFSFLDASFSSIVYTGYTALASRNRCSGFIHEGLWLDTGTISALEKAEALLERYPAILERVRKNLGRYLAASG